MAYNYEFPYYGDANYNNDWLISKLKEIASNLSQLSIDFDDLKAQFNAFSDTTSESITSLQNDVNTLKTQVEAIIAGGGGNVGDLTDILNRISALETNFAGLQTTVAGHTTDISGLQTTVAGHTTDISGLQTTVAGHTGAISSIMGDLAEISTSIDEIEGTLSSHQTQLQNLISQGNEQNATLVQQGQQISSLQEQINSLPTGGDGTDIICLNYTMTIEFKSYNFDAGVINRFTSNSLTTFIINKIPPTIPEGYELIKSSGDYRVSVFDMIYGYYTGGKNYTLLLEGYVNFSEMYGLEAGIIGTSFRDMTVSSTYTLNIPLYYKKIV